MYKIPEEALAAASSGHPGSLPISSVVELSRMNLGSWRVHREEPVSEA